MKEYADVYFSPEDGTNSGNTDFAHEIARLQRCVDKHIRRYVEKQVAKTGVYRGQHQTLMWLGCNPGASQAKLAKARDISPAAATNALQKLEKEGYIERVADAQDGRANHVNITAKGQEVIEQSKLIFQEIDMTIFEDFSEEELCQFKGCLEKILGNVKHKLEEIE